MEISTSFGCMYASRCLPLNRSRVLHWLHWLHCFLHGTHSAGGVRGSVHLMTIRKYVRQLQIYNNSIANLEELIYIYIKTVQQRKDCFIQQHRPRLHSIRTRTAAAHRASTAVLNTVLVAYQQQYICEIPLFYNQIIARCKRTHMVRWRVCVHCTAAHPVERESAEIVAPMEHLRYEYVQYTLSKLYDTPSHTIRLTFDTPGRKVWCSVHTPTFPVNVSLVDTQGVQLSRVRMKVCSEDTLKDLVVSLMHSPQVKTTLLVVLGDSPPNVSAACICNLQCVHPSRRISETGMKPHDTLVCVLLAAADVEDMHTKTRHFTRCVSAHSGTTTCAVHGLCYRDFFALPRSLTEFMRMCALNPLQTLLLRNTCQTIATYHLLQTIHQQGAMWEWLVIHCSLMTNVLWNDDAYHNRRVEWTSAVAQQLSVFPSQHVYDHSLFLFHLILNRDASGATRSIIAYLQQHFNPS